MRNSWVNYQDREDAGFFDASLWEKAKKEGDAAIKWLIDPMLSNVNQTFFHIRDRQELLEAACHIAVESGSFPMAWMGLADEEGQRVRLVAHWGMDEGYLDTIDVSLRDGPAGMGPAGTAVCTGEQGARPEGGIPLLCGLPPQARFSDDRGLLGQCH